MLGPGGAYCICAGAVLPRYRNYFILKHCGFVYSIGLLKPYTYASLTTTAIAPTSAFHRASSRIAFSLTTLILPLSQLKPVLPTHWQLGSRVGLLTQPADHCSDRSSGSITAQSMAERHGLIIQI
jgi:hypothetical protein